MATAAQPDPEPEGQPRGRTRRFRAELTDAQCWVAIEEVLLGIRPEAPATVSRTEFNARKHEFGWAHCPEAKRLQERLVPLWDDLKRLALAADHRQRQGAVVAARKHLTSPLRADLPPFTQEDCDWAMLTAWKRIAQVHPDGAEHAMSKDEFALERRTMAALAEERLGDLAPAIPTESEIESVTGERWSETNARLGLPTIERSEGLAAPPTLTRVQAYELALETHGALPSLKELLLFVKTHDLRMQGPTVTTAAHMAALRAGRTERHLWTPPAVPPKSERPDWAAPVETLPAGLTHRVRRDRSPDEKLDALLLWLEHLDSHDALEDREPTTRNYNRWSDESPDRPSMTVLIAGDATFDEQVREAMRVWTDPSSRVRVHPTTVLLDRARKDVTLRVLAYLRQHGRASLPDLKAMTGLSQAVVSEHLQRLEQAEGIVALVVPQDPARRKYVDLHPACPTRCSFAWRR